jgi:hypothetical protein
MNSNDVLEKCVLAINFIALHLCIALSTDYVCNYAICEKAKKNKTRKQLQVMCDNNFYFLIHE